MYIYVYTPLSLYIYIYIYIHIKHTHIYRGAHLPRRAGWARASGVRAADEPLALSVSIINIITIGSINIVRSVIIVSSMITNTININIPEYGVQMSHWHSAQTS